MTTNSQADFRTTAHYSGASAFEASLPMKNVAMKSYEYGMPE